MRLPVSLAGLPGWCSESLASSLTRETWQETRAQEQYPDVGKWVLHFFCREDQISRKDDPVCVEGALPRVRGYLLGGWVAGSLLPLPGLC